MFRKIRTKNTVIRCSASFQTHSNSSPSHPLPSALRLKTTNLLGCIRKLPCARGVAPPLKPYEKKNTGIFWHAEKGADISNQLHITGHLESHGCHHALLLKSTSPTLTTCPPFFGGTIHYSLTTPYSVPSSRSNHPTILRAARARAALATRSFASIAGDAQGRAPLSRFEPGHTVNYIDFLHKLPRLRKM